MRVISRVYQPSGRNRLPSIGRAVCWGWLAFELVLGCGGDKATNPEPQQQQNYTLTITKLEGATSVEPNGSSTLSAGTRVNYAFQASPGYDNLQVTLDSQLVSPTGQVTMNGNHKLMAAALPAKDLPASDPVLLATQALLTAPNRTTAFANYLNQLRRLSASQSDSSLRLLVRKAEEMTLDPARDAAAVRQLGDALDGKTFELRDDTATLVSFSAGAAASASSVTRDDATPTTVIYVNGIFTTPDGAALSATQLVGSLRNHGIPTGSATNSLDLGGGTSLPVRFLFHYNNSAVNTLSPAAIRECIAGLGLGAWRWLVRGSQPADRIAQCPDFNGPQEVTEQWLSTYVGVGMTATLPLGVGGSLRTVIDAERRAGRNVILVGHSQGNLLIQTALAGLPALPNTSNVGCMSAVSIASPSGADGWAGLDVPVSGTIAGDDGLGRQDLLRRVIPGPKFSVMTSSEVAYWAAWVNAWPVGTRYALGIYADVNLHFLDTYLRAGQTASFIGDAMEGKYKQLATACGSAITGQVISASDGAAVGGALVEIRTRSGALLSTATADAVGNFSFAKVDARTYQITATATGYVSLPPSNVIVTPRSPVALGRIPLVKTTTQLGSASGVISDARTIRAISGARVDLRTGLNNFQGAVAYTTTTNSSGAFSIGSVTAGVYTATVTASGYATNARSVAVNGGTATAGQNVELYPLGNTSIGIVLFWGASPSDLDAHLTGPSSVGRFHIYWASKGALNSDPFAALDVDDISSFGPETITITQQASGIYRFSVHDYSDRNVIGATDLATSGATIRLFLPGKNPITFTVPNQAGNLWTVFELNGSQLTVINSMSDTSSPAGVTLRSQPGAAVDDREAIAASAKDKH